MEVRAYAKLNLTLDVLGKRPDGYHDLRMVMQSVDLCDHITLERRQEGGVSVFTDRAYLPCDERNLAVKAARAFFGRTGEEWGLSIRIRKAIPVCAGMGGGSSDAAAVLRALNELGGTGFSARELAKIGEAVGSDVPYCVLGGTVLAEGRGEVLTPLPPLPDCWIVACKPAFSISTPELFGRIDAHRLAARPDTPGMLAALEAGDLGGIARRLYNVFEDVLPERQGRTVAEIKTTLIDRGALGACMSGTGPTVYGLFDRPDAARGAFDALSGSFPDTFLCKNV